MRFDLLPETGFVHRYSGAAAHNTSFQRDVSLVLSLLIIVPWYFKQIGSFSPESSFLSFLFFLLADMVYFLNVYRLRSPAIFSFYSSFLFSFPASLTGFFFFSSSRLAVIYLARVSYSFLATVKAAASLFIVKWCGPCSQLRHAEAIVSRVVGGFFACQENR